MVAKTLGSPKTFWRPRSFYSAGSRDRDVQGCPWIAFSRAARSLSSHEESCVVTVEPLSHQQVGLLGTQRGWPPTPPLPSSPARTSEKPASTTTTTTTTGTVHRESVSLVTGLLVVFSIQPPLSMGQPPPPRPRAAAAPLLRTIINGRRAFASPRQSNENDRGARSEKLSAATGQLRPYASVNLFAGLLVQAWQAFKLSRLTASYFASGDPSTIPMDIDGTLGSRTKLAIPRTCFSFFFFLLFHCGGPGSNGSDRFTRVAPFLRRPFEQRTRDDIVKRVHVTGMSWASVEMFRQLKYGKLGTFGN